MMEDEFYLQDNRQYVGNDILWWAKDGKGYTTDLSLAQVYTKQQAIKHNQARETDVPWPKSYIDARTPPAVDMQHVDIQVALQDTGITLAQPAQPRHEKYKCENCGRFVDKEEFNSLIDTSYPCHLCLLDS